MIAALLMFAAVGEVGAQGSMSMLLSNMFLQP
jgi:hypothetical protein